MNERKVVVVTGSNGGVGFEVARAMAKEGWHVVINGRREQVLDEAVALIREEVADASVEGVVADMSDADQATDLVNSTAAKHGRIDGLVNNAAWVLQKHFSDMTVQDWDSMMNLKLRGYAVTCMAATAHMREQGGGRIVNVGSKSGHTSDPNLSAYNSANAGVEGLTRSLAVDLGRFNITANVVAPGWTWTPALKRAGFYGGSHDFLKQVNPLGRAGEQDEPAEVARWLLTTAPTYLTGQVIYVDGGKTAMAKLYHP